MTSPNLERLAQSGELTIGRRISKRNCCSAAYRSFPSDSPDPFHRIPQ